MAGFNSDASTGSCIEVTTVRLATLAVIQLWGETVETVDLDALQGRDPP